MIFCCLTNRNPELGEPGLLRALDNAEEDIRICALLILSFFNPLSGAAERKIRGLLSDNFKDVRTVAWDILKQIAERKDK